MTHLTPSAGPAPTAPADPSRSTFPPRTLVGERLVKRYRTAGPGAPPALGGVDLTVAAGESIAVMGPSGSGKSTLLHVLAGILRPDEGRVVWDGRDLAALGDRGRTRLRREELGFVFQSGQLLPELPAVENVALPLMLGGASRREAEARAGAMFAPLGLEGLQGRRPGELSGGQAQRVAIARALIGSPGIVFADEPTGALDRNTGGEVLQHLVAACAQHRSALVVVTHDPEVASWCSRRVGVRDGRVTSLRDAVVGR